MSAAELLARLENVRKTGADRWIATCPTRPDNHPSLSIRELPDGRVLIHDFGGDAALDVLTAIGLDIAALFPEKLLLRRNYKAERRPFNVYDILKCIVFEAAIALDCANQLRAGKALSAVDHARLVTASARLVGALDVAAGE